GYQLLARTVLETASRATRDNEEADGPALLEAVGVGYVRFALEHPEHFTMMFRPATAPAAAIEVDDADFLMAREAAYGVLTSTIQKCAHQGYLDGLDAEMATTASWSIVHGLAALLLS